MWNTITGPALMICLGAIGGISLLHANFSGPLSEPFEDGATQLALEDALDDVLVLRSQAIQGWSAARYALFREALPGAVPGRDGWLFSDEEYIAATGFEARRAASVQAIVQWSAQLEQAGATVVVALLPDKARIMPDMLRRQRPPVVEARYEATLEDLAAGGVSVVDLRPILHTARAEQPVFLRTDTHWTPEGARAVAHALAPQITDATADRTEFETIPAPAEPYEGDLLSFLDLGPFAEPLGVTPDIVTPYHTAPLPAAGGGLGLGLFDDIAIPATLVGTSYSALPQWNFIGFLQQESATDIVNLSQEGQGPFAPMRSYIDEVAAADLNGEAIIWEIPERYLTLEGYGP